MEIMASKIPKHLLNKIYDQHSNGHIYSQGLSSYIGESIVKKYYFGKFGTNHEELVILRDKYGKPYLQNSKLGYFNISHSGDWVVCAFDSSPIGIDIERKEVIDLEVMYRFYSSSEVFQINSRSLEEQISWFYKIWTLKESYLKALGIGLRVPLNSIEFFINNEKDIQYFSKIDREKWHFRLYEIDPAYEMAICQQTYSSSVEVQILDFHKLLDKYLSYDKF